MARVLGLSNKITFHANRLMRSANDLMMDYSRISWIREKYRSKGKPNAVFIWIPKTAGTSIFSTLNVLKIKSMHRVKYRFTDTGIVTFGHMDYSKLVEYGHISDVFDKSAYKFSFVRNPYSRAVSLYFYLKKRRGKLQSNESFLEFTRRLNNQECTPIGLINAPGLSQCNPQVRWVENIEMDFIGKLENLSEDMNKVFLELNLKSRSVPKLNTSTAGDYKEIYCPESKLNVENFYREDFEAFGYNLEKF